MAAQDEWGEFAEKVARGATVFAHPNTAKEIRLALAEGGIDIDVMDNEYAPEFYVFAVDMDAYWEGKTEGSTSAAKWPSLRDWRYVIGVAYEQEGEVMSEGETTAERD